MEMKKYNWVINKGDGRLGIILNTNPEDGRLFIDWKTGLEGSRMVRGWYSKSSVYPAPLSLNEEDALSMIDLALDTNDTEWAQQIFNLYLDRTS